MIKTPINFFVFPQLPTVVASVFLSDSVWCPRNVLDMIVSPSSVHYIVTYLLTYLLVKSVKLKTVFSFTDRNYRTT